MPWLECSTDSDETRPGGIKSSNGYASGSVNDSQEDVILGSPNTTVNEVDVVQRSSYAQVRGFHRPSSRHPPSSARELHERDREAIKRGTRQRP